MKNAVSGADPHIFQDILTNHMANCILGEEWQAARFSEAGWMSAGTGMGIDMQNHVLSYLNQIVKEKPDKLAYSDGTEGLTFREVYRYSRQVGSFLHEKGIYKRPVVVFMRKSPKEVTAFFGVITGGCFYVPIDEEMPSGRIQLILDNVRSPLIDRKSVV